MNVGDLVIIKKQDDLVDLRPETGSIGVIVEINRFNSMEEYYYVLIRNVGWRYFRDELELLNGSR